MKTDAHGHPVLEQFSSHGFVDCVLKIVDLVETETHYRFRLAGSYNGEVVGMDAAVVKDLQPGLDPEMNPIEHHARARGVLFFRSGPESDRLIRALAQLYGDADPTLKMITEESFTAVALHHGAVDLAVHRVKIKLLARGGCLRSKADYHESFFSLDLRNRLVFWTEKDRKYREALVRSLSVSTAGPARSPRLQAAGQVRPRGAFRPPLFH
jgi:hypothetical protein